jgi:DNA-binding MarR family transcriptional regulator
MLATYHSRLATQPPTPMLLLRDLPKYETLLAYAQRYPETNPGAVEAYLNMLRLSSDIIAEVEAFFAAYGCSQGRFTVLALLNRTPDKPLNPADLARRSGVTRATMTGLLQGLEHDGLVEREASSKDKRMFLVLLTKRGRKYVDEVLPELFRRIKELMNGLSDQERKLFLGLLEKVGTRLPALAAPVPMHSKSVRPRLH